jgi:hypothetical protein
VEIVTNQRREASGRGRQRQLDTRQTCKDLDDLQALLAFLYKEKLCPFCLIINQREREHYLTECPHANSPDGRLSAVAATFGDVLGNKAGTNEYKEEFDWKIDGKSLLYTED